MARAKFGNDRGSVEIEITDIALIVSVLGITAAALAAGWMATRNPQTLRILAGTAARRGVRLVQSGRPMFVPGVGA